MSEYNIANSKIDDKFKNVVMRFSSNPKDFIMYMILNHRDEILQYIEYTQYPIIRNGYQR